MDFYLTTSSSPFPPFQITWMVNICGKFFSFDVDISQYIGLAGQRPRKLLVLNVGFFATSCPAKCVMYVLRSMYIVMLYVTNVVCIMQL